MRMVNKGGAVLTLLALLVAPAGVAHAQLTAEPVPGFAGTVTVDGVPSRPIPAPALVAVAYDNTASPANFGVSSTDLNAVWGDQLFTTTTGLLSGLKFTVFNSGSSGGGPLLTANVQIEVYDWANSILLGSFGVNVNFGAGLGPNLYTIVNITNLDGLGINVGVTDVGILQRVTALTGSANRLGIASLMPITVGASPSHMYIAASTIGGGVPGLYTFGNGPANPGYQVSIALPPVGTASKSWGELKKLYR